MPPPGFLVRALVGSALAWNLAVGVVLLRPLHLGVLRNLQEAFSTNCRSLLVQLWDTGTSSLWGTIPAGKAFGAVRNHKGLKIPLHCWVDSTSLEEIRSIRQAPVEARERYHGAGPPQGT